MKKLLLAAAAALSFAMPTHAATLLINGSFEESPMVAGNAGGNFDTLNSSGRSWDIWNALPGWYARGPGIEIQSNRTLGQIDAQDGTRYVELDTTSNSMMVQNVALDAGRYELSFYYMPRQSRADTNDILASVFGWLSGDLASILAQGSRTRDTDWVQFSQIFEIETAQTVSISFRAEGRSDSLGGLIDNVALAAVPLPAGMLLLVSGLAGLAVMRRRSRG